MRTMAVTAAPPSPVPSYPVHVDADAEPVASRWLWLVKWVLAVPHLVLLVFLWAAFVVLSVVALVAIVVTGRYPRSIFEFNVGVLRWSWRVAYYAYGALATDRYPPFSLSADVDYPARLTVEYPAHLSRGLALVKWWLLAIPHYVVVGLFLGTGVWVVQEADGPRWLWGGGLVGILVLVAAVVLAVTGAYPRPVYDLLLGLNRWVLRVAAYAALMTDAYPPFRLDQGPHEPEGALVVPAPPAAGGSPAAAWTAGRVVAAVSGSVAALLGLALLVGGGGALVVDRALRDDDGYLGRTDRFSSAGYALVFGEMEYDAPVTDSALPGRLVGDLRVRAAATDGAPVFVGIAPATEAQAYLDGVAYTEPGLGDRSGRDVAGAAPSAAPTAVDVWDVRATGPGEQEVTWPARTGRWTVVVMNADGTPGVAARVSVGATVPWLDEAGVGLVVAGLLLAAVSVLLVVVAVRRSGR